ncbi:hypothetical protein ACTFIZ_012568 [Dictyostelium cf. discoideum]
MIVITREESIQCINNALKTKYTFDENDPKKDFFKIIEGSKKLTITFYNKTNKILVQGSNQEELKLIKELLKNLNDKRFNNTNNSFSGSTNLDTKKEDIKVADGANSNQQDLKKLKAFIVSNNKIQQEYSDVLEGMNILKIVCETQGGKIDIKSHEKLIDTCDFGIVFVTYGGGKVEDYSKVFEMGLFYGLLGKSKTIYVDLAPKGIKLQDFISDIQELNCVSTVKDFENKVTEISQNLRPKKD